MGVPRKEEGVGVSRTKGGRCGWVSLGRREEGVGVSRTEEGVGGCV